MKQNSFTLLCICWLILVGIQTRAQNLKARESVVEPPRTIVSSHVNESGQLLRVFRDEQGLQKLQSGFSYMKTEEGFVFPDGTSLVLPQEEHVISVANNKVLTHQWGPSTTGVTFIAYNLSGKTLTPTGTLAFPGVEINATLINSDIITVDDLSEGYGTYLKLYNSNLNLLTDYKPFDNGYSEVRTSSSGNLLIAVFERPNEKKLAIFNARNGRLVNEGRLSSRIVMRHLVTFEDALVLYDGSAMEAFSMTGSKLWEKSGITTPSYDIFSDNENAYFFTASDIVCIGGKSGAIRWTKPLSSMLSNARTSTPGGHIRPISFTTNGGEPAFVLAMMPPGSRDPQVLKSDSKFVQFDTAGRIKKQFTISGDKKFITVSPVPGGLKVFTNNETLTYEN